MKADVLMSLLLPLPQTLPASFTYSETPCLILAVSLYHDYSSRSPAACSQVKIYKTLPYTPTELNYFSSVKSPNTLLPKVVDPFIIRSKSNTSLSLELSALIYEKDMRSFLIITIKVKIE